MDTLEIFEIYNLLCSGFQNVKSRNQTRLLRKVAFESVTSAQGIVKVAFDTRRINQETDFIPRRGLQNYHRSEKFITDSILKKITAFNKLNTLLDVMKDEYGKEPEWQDSYTRVLSSAISKGLRTQEQDEDFSEAQPSMASLDYLEELLYVRYRLTPEELMSRSEEELRTIILSKDDLLSRRTITKTTNVVPTDDSKLSYDRMVDKMLSVLSQMATSQQKVIQSDSPAPQVTKNVSDNEKTVTITIKV